MDRKGPLFDHVIVFLGKILFKPLQGTLIQGQRSSLWAPVYGFKRDSYFWSSLLTVSRSSDLQNEQHIAEAP